MKKLLIILAFTASVFAENVIDINLNETDVEAGYEHVKNYSQNTKIYFPLHFLSAKDEFGHKNPTAQAEILAVGLTALPGLGVGVGSKLVFSHIKRPEKNAQILAASIKAIVLYTLPLKIKTSINLSYAYAPQSLSFLDLNRYRELRFGLDVEIIDGAMIYVGYRNLEPQLKNSSFFDLNKNAYFGVKFVF